MPSEATEAGADQGLPTDGGGVHQKPGADETPGRKTGGEFLFYVCLTHYLCVIVYVAVLNFHCQISLNHVNDISMMIRVFCNTETKA